MQATRRYWSSIMSSLGMFALFLTGFIIFGILVGALIAGPNAFQSPQVEVAHNTDHTTFFNQTLSNGTIVTGNVTTTNTTYTYENACTNHKCAWWLYRLAVLLAVIALSLFVLAFSFSAIGVAVQESNFLRAGVAKSGAAYAGLEVVNPPFSFVGTVFFTLLGLWSILAAVLIIIAAVAGRDEWAFIACAIILGVFALVAGLVLLFMFFRNEAPIVVQPVVAAVPVNSGVPVAGPGAGAAYL